MIILSPLVKPKIKEQAAVHNTEANTVSKVRQIPIGKVMTMMNGTINDAIVGSAILPRTSLTNIIIGKLRSLFII